MGIGNVFSLLKSRGFWIVIVLMLLLAEVSNMDYEEALQAHSTYCHMVELYEATDGTAGWPAYRNDVKCS